MSTTVNCPICRRPTLYGPENEWRPFCSQRCKLIDLGAWASDAYRIEASGPADDEDEGVGGEVRPEDER
ncbi:MAG: DNA gyrase inhibitor YacG [Pseudomonadota bacterium]|nr:DNA gyrase inhibitor YacG [Pseudomonadota bacterium]